MNNPLLQPDPGLFIWTILTFLVLATALAKFAWGPLLRALDERQQAIRGALDDAQQAKLELGRLEQESAQIIRKARSDAEAIITQSRADGDRLREELRRRPGPRQRASPEQPSARSSWRRRGRFNRFALKPSTSR